MLGVTNVTVSGCTFTGAISTGLTTTGTAVALIGGTGSVIGTSKFTGLTTALNVSGAATVATFNGNTVDKCGGTCYHPGPDTIVVTAQVVYT